MYEDSADSAVMENLFRIMYQNHPCAITLQAQSEHRGDHGRYLKLCHDAFYDPRTSSCVIGDVDAAHHRAGAG